MLPILTNLKFLIKENNCLKDYSVVYICLEMQKKVQIIS